MNRRSFFKAVATGAAAVVVGQLPVNLPVPAPVPPDVNILCVGGGGGGGSGKRRGGSGGGFLVPTEYAAQLIYLIERGKPSVSIHHVTGEILPNETNV